MIRLIVSDIDGTLTEDGGKPAGSGALRGDPEAQKPGGSILRLPVARHSASIEYIFDPIKDKIFYIGDNGAYLGCYGRGAFF